MRSRYTNNETRTSGEGKRVFRSKIYPKIPFRDDDVYVATETGDRLDTLAHTFYNDSTLWWIIASANNIHDSVFALEDGTVLRIPQNYIEIVNNFID